MKREIVLIAMVFIFSQVSLGKQLPPADPGSAANNNAQSSTIVDANLDLADGGGQGDADPVSLLPPDVVNQIEFQDSTFANPVDLFPGLENRMMLPNDFSPEVYNFGEESIGRFFEIKRRKIEATHPNYRFIEESQNPPTLKYTNSATNEEVRFEYSDVELDQFVSAAKKKFFEDIRKEFEMQHTNYNQIKHFRTLFIVNAAPGVDYSNIPTN